MQRGILLDCRQNTSKPSAARRAEQAEQSSRAATTRPFDELLADSALNCDYRLVSV